MENQNNFQMPVNFKFQVKPENREPNTKNMKLEPINLNSLNPALPNNENIKIEKSESTFESPHHLIGNEMRKIPVLKTLVTTPRDESKNGIPSPTTTTTILLFGKTSNESGINPKIPNKRELIPNSLSSTGDDKKTSHFPHKTSTPLSSSNWEGISDSGNGKIPPNETTPTQRTLLANPHKNQIQNESTSRVEKVREEIKKDLIPKSSMRIERPKNFISQRGILLPELPFLPKESNSKESKIGEQLKSLKQAKESNVLELSGKNSNFSEEVVKKRFGSLSLSRPNIRPFSFDDFTLAGDLNERSSGVKKSGPLVRHTSVENSTRARTCTIRPSASFHYPTQASALKEVTKFTQLASKENNILIQRGCNKLYKMGDNAATVGMKEIFSAFSKFGDTASDGKLITLTNSDKWMKQAGVIDGKKITTTDTSIAFKKLFKTAKKVNYADYSKFLESLATAKKIPTKEIIDKMIACGTPKLSQATKAAQVGVVERLTDTSKYTGSHKERFDSAGKGRGIDGRKDASPSGYVQGFKKETPTPT